MKNGVILLALALALAMPGMARSSDPLVDEVDGALLRLADAGRLPNGEQMISRPPRVHHELGAVLDLARRGDGAEVVAVTPGGAAARLGVRSGDRVLALNGVALGDGVDAETLRAAIEAADGALALDVRRDGRVIEFRGEADSIMLPGYQLLLAAAPATQSGCARISVFDVAPRSQNIFGATIIAVDGGLPGPGVGGGFDLLQLAPHTFRVEPGLRRITVAERIPAHRVPSQLRLHRDRFRGREAHRELVLDVQPGMTYRIGARLLPENVGARSDTYWEPVVYREFAQPCR